MVLVEDQLLTSNRTEIIEEIFGFENFVFIKNSVKDPQERQGIRSRNSLVTCSLRIRGNYIS